MLIVKHSVQTQASPTTIWSIWQDLSNWKTWDHGIEFSTIDGPFETETTGTLKPKGGPLVHTKLTYVDPMKMFIDEAKLPLTRLIVTHFCTKMDGKTEVTHQIEMKRCLAFVFAFLIGRTMKKNLPQEMEALLKQAESLEKAKQ